MERPVLGLLGLRFDVSLTVLAPAILAGAAVLALILADLSLGEPRSPRLGQLCLVAALGVYLASTVLFLLVLRPVRRFLESAGRSPLLAETVEAVRVGATADDLERFDRLFGRVADVLGKLDARAQFPEIIGESRAMRAVFAQILKVAPTEATVLLTGESGTGKELAARALHAHSPRSKGPLVCVNCAAIPEGLLESELFGHEKGAFTGAVSRKPGKFEQASGGAIFLDEIGDMPLSTQAKILRAIQNRECERLGGTKPIPLDIRILAATNRDLSERIAAGLFREDLYHRLNVFHIALPPLRERREDIPLLAGHFLETSGKDVTFSSSALRALVGHAWPGNVRELQNVAERAAVLAGEGEAGLEHLPSHLLAVEAAPLRESDSAEYAAMEPDPGQGPGLDARLDALEKSLILAALTRAGGVQARAAELLGVKPRSLWHRIKKHRLDPRAVKNSLRSR